MLKRHILPHKILPRLLVSFSWRLSKSIMVSRAITRQKKVASHLQTLSLAKQTTEEDLQGHIPESLVLKCVSKSSTCLTRFGRNTEIQTIFYYTGSQLKCTDMAIHWKWSWLRIARKSAYICHVNQQRDFHTLIKKGNLLFFMWETIRRKSPPTQMHTPKTATFY